MKHKVKYSNSNYFKYVLQLFVDNKNNLKKGILLYRQK